MQKKERYRLLIEHFSQKFPEAETELNYSNPFELLVAVILSAQCTDKRINMITPALFQRYPDPQSMADSEVEEVFQYIRSVSYPNNKAKHLVGMARMLLDKFEGEIPSTIEELQLLPGVGRKTANVIVSVVYNQPALAVDTHVFRVSHRLGLVSKAATTPFAVEKEVVKHVPDSIIPIFHHWLILHGRYVCLARTPQCAKCELTHLCKFYETLQKKMKASDKVQEL